jgi:hypothetical protein
MVADKRQVLIDHGLRMKEEAGHLGLDALSLLEPN